MTKEMTPEERELIQSHIKDMFERFKTVVKEGRPQFAANPDALDKLATGEIFTAPKALENTLIDKIGFLEDAIDRALALASLDKNKTKIVKFKAPRLAGRHVQPQPIAWRQFQPQSRRAARISAPRAWFICTSLPALINTRH